MRLILLILSLNTFLIFAQPDTIHVEEPIDTLELEIEINHNEDGLITWEESEPEFPGGEAAMMQFIFDNLEFPQEEHCASGTTYVEFWIEKDGSVSNAVVVRGVCKVLDEEALKLIEKMPKWKPGTFKGEAIRVKFTLPLTICTR